MDPFVGRRLSTVNEQDLGALVNQAVSESIHLDFKRTLELSNPVKHLERENRQELLKDITAFANSRGGLLIYGIEEGRDTKGELNGEAESICGFDCANIAQLKTTIEELIAAGIDETIYGSIEIASFALENGKAILLIRVPQSLRAPHMVKLGGKQAFHRRTNTRNEPMTASQIRDVAMQSAAIDEQVARLLENRRQILRDRFAGTPFVTLHLVPLLRSPRQLDVTLPTVIERMKQTARKMDERIGSHHWKFAHTLEGFEATDSAGTELWTRTTFHRDGIIEIVDGYQLRASEQLYRYDQLEPQIHRFLNAGMRFLREGPAGLPIAVAISLENLSGFTWPIFSPIFEPAKPGNPMPDGSVAPEPIIVNEFVDDYRPLLKPIWDLFWNAGGQPRCSAYDENLQYKDYGAAR